MTWPEWLEYSELINLEPHRSVYLPMIIFHFYQKGKGLEGSEKLDVSAPLAVITPS